MTVEPPSSELTDRTNPDRADDVRLRLALDAARLGTWERNLQTGEDFWSVQQETLFGLRSGDFGSRHAAFVALVHPDDREAINQATRDAVERGLPYQSEYRIIRSDGSLRWMSGRGDVIRDADGTPTHMVGVTVDITDRKLAEEERARLHAAEKAAREEAESANRLKDEFLAVVSHELRTPLNAIMGWAQLLLRDRSDPAEVEHGLHAIERNSRSMAQLVEDVLDVSRIIRGKLRLNIQNTDLPAVIDNAVAAIRPAAAAKNIQIDRQITPASLRLRADPDRMQQVVWNLLSNAIKFTPPGGQVQIRMEVYEGGVQIDVIDSGTGIPAAFLPHVFERFAQADTSTRRSTTGLGLGLAIVRHLVELHGGTAHAQSEGQDKGATFTVMLPLREAQALESASAGPQASIPQRGQLAGLSVLIVDDDADSRQMAKVLLARAGATVTTAASVDDALRSARAQPPDVLISDIGMPMRDGFDLVRELDHIRKQTGRAIPAAAMTGFASADDCAKALKAGFVRHLTKPLDFNAMVETVLALAGGKS